MNTMTQTNWLKTLGVMDALPVRSRNNILCIATRWKPSMECDDLLSIQCAMNNNNNNLWQEHSKNVTTNAPMNWNVA